MAKLSDLVPAVANSFGFAERTVAIYARHLREARLISTGGRGPGGAEMTPRDCANLLMVTVAGHRAKDAALTIQHYGSLPAKGDGKRDRWKLENLRIPELIALEKGHSFGAALEALTASAKDGHLQQALVEAHPTGGKSHIAFDSIIQISLMSPSPAAMITFTDINPTWNEQIFYSEQRPQPQNSLEAIEAFESWNAKCGGGDMVQVRTFTARTITVLGELLRS